MKPFTADELAFFVVPRTWPDILARFGKYTEELRDRVIAADDVPPPNGGAGFLHWTQASKTWTLTRFGRMHVIERGMPGVLEMNEAWRPPRPRVVGVDFGPRPSVTAVTVVEGGRVVSSTVIDPDSDTSGKGTP